jgi:hypothetical protein
MSKWEDVIDEVIKGLESETPGVSMYETNVDHKIHEGELIAASAEPVDLEQTPDDRKKEFRADLKEALRERISQSPNAAPLKLALDFLEGRRSRVPDHLRPSYRKPRRSGAEVKTGGALSSTAEEFIPNQADFGLRA